MTGPGALAVTGFVLFIVATVLTIYTVEFAWGQVERLAARAAWVAFALGCSCVIAAVWWDAA